MDERESSSQRIPPPAQPESDQEMMDLLAGPSAGFRSLRRGEMVEGVVVHVGRDEILVDIGTKAEAVIPAAEVGVPHGDISSAVQAGETIIAMVLEPEDHEGHPILSLARAQSERGWRRLQQTFEAAETIEAEVVEYNKGGLIVHIDGVRGFVPLSQIVDLRQAPAPGTDDSTDARLERMKGKMLALKVIEMNRRRNRLILSERAADQERRVRDRDRLIEELEAGQTRPGRVSSVCDFGAFVDLGGADGLVHLTELAWTLVGHPSQVVHVGDQVDVLVLGVDKEKKKIALSLKRLRGEPWERITERYQVGQTVAARITKLATFGAFAEIEPGVEGLIHISELSDERIQHPKSVVREGDAVNVKVLRIEPERRRLGLSLRQAQAEAEAAEMAGLPMVYGDEPGGGLAADRWRGASEVLADDGLRETSDQPEPDSPDAAASPGDEEGGDPADRQAESFA